MIRVVAALAALLSLPTMGEAVTNRTELELSNGLHVILEEDHSKPLVAVITYVNGGSRTEGPGLEGLSHYYEHIIFRGGTERQEELETRRAFQPLGDYGGYTSHDATAYSFLVPKENLEEAMWRYADALLNVEVTSEKVEKDRQSIVQELHMRVSDDPGGKVYVNLFAEAFREHPYRVTPIGLEEVVREAQLPTFHTFFRERYVPNQMALAAVGDFDTEEMLGLIRKHFGELEQGPASFELGVREPEQTSFREVAEEMTVKLVYGGLGFKVPETAHPDTPVLQVIRELLTGGLSSRLQQKLRRTNLVTSVWSYLPTLHDPGVMMLGFEAEPDREREALQGLLDELRRLAEEPVEEEELTRVKRQLLAAQAFAQESPLGRATQLVSYAIVADTSLLDRYPAEVEAVGPEDIRRVAARTFVREGATLSLVRPEGAGEGASYLGMVDKGLMTRAGEERAGASASELALIDLPGGARLALQADPGAALAALAVEVPGGCLAEEEGEEGAAYLLSRALLRGTSRRDADELARAVEGLGYRISAGSGMDRSQLTLTGPAGSFGEALAIALEVLFDPALEKDEVGTLREEVLARIRAVPDDSFQLTRLEFTKRVFPGSAYGRLVWGTEESVAKLRPADLKGLHRKLYVPANLVFSVAGGVDGGQVRSALSKALQGRKEGKAFAYPEVRPAALPDAPEVALVPKEARQITFNLGAWGPPVRHPDYHAFSVARSVLGFRLFYKYVYDIGVAYRMWTRLDSRVQPAPLWFEMGVSPENYTSSRDGIVADLRGFLDGPVTEVEMERAKGTLVQRFALGQQTVMGQASLAGALVVEGREEELESYPDTIRSVTPERMREVAGRYWDPERYWLVVVGPETP